MMKQTTAELFNTFFSIVFTNENMDSMPMLNPRHNGITLSDLIISPDMVVKNLKKLKPTKSAAPD